MALKINKGKNHSYPKTEEAWVKHINTIHRSAQNERQTTEAQWARNIAYYWGFQNLIYDPVIRLLEVDPSRSNDYIVNKIAPFVEQRVAKLTRAKPILTVTPNKEDALTVKGAETSEKVFKHLWRLNNRDDKTEYEALLMVLQGSSFHKTIWNAKGGEPIRVDQDENGNIVFDEKTGVQKSQLVWQGDISCFPRSAWEILAARGAKDIQDAEWIIERTQRTVAYIQETFEDFDPEKLIKRYDEMSRFEKFVYSLGCPAMGTYGFGFDRADYDDEVKENQIVLVKEYWQKPCLAYPEGIVATVVGDQLLQFEPWPYDHNQYPFVKFDEHKNPFGFYGLSTLTRLLPIQQHYNRERSQIDKNTELMANVKWWAPKGCGLSEDSITDEEGEIVETNSNMPEPHQMAIVPLPNYVIQNLEISKQDFTDVGGERTVDQQPFAQLTAGVAIETMAELADIGLSTTIKNIEKAIILSGKQELMLANQFYTEERTIMVAGKDKGTMSAISFKGLDLAHQTDLVVQIESGLGYTKAAVRQNLMDMWDRRIIIDPEIFMKAFACGDLDLVLKQKDAAETLVLQDIEMIKEGKMPPVLPFDNHIIYIKMLTAYIQTPEFRRQAPDRQQLALQALQMHLQFMQPQQPMMGPNPAGVNTPFGPQVTEGLEGGPEGAAPPMPMA